jgi:hypothetical protein
MHPGKMPLATQKLPLNPDGGLGHTVLRRNAATQVHMRGHRVPLSQLQARPLAQCPQQRSHTPSQLSIEATASVLWDKHSVLLAIPSDVRVALPCAHGDLLASARDGSLKGGLYYLLMHDGTAEPRGVAPPKAVAYPM